MRAQTMSLEDVYLPGQRGPFLMAIAFHAFLFVWNPTILTSGASFHPPAIMNIQYRETLPPMPIVEPVKPKEVPKPAPKKEKPVVKKAHKAGLSLHKEPAPLAVTPKPRPVAAPVKKPFVSKIEMPKFVPHAMSEDIVAASPAPGISAPARQRMTQGPAPVAKLKGKTRGFLASDVNFKLEDRGTALAGAADRVVAVPIGEERGDVAVLPQAAVLHNAPKGKSTVAGFRFTPGTGSGSGELSGKNRGNYGYHGVARADTYEEGSLYGGGGTGKGKATIGGQGFELGGPVGDRKILHRQLPEYPAWAEEKGITAMVKVYFTVKPDGSIRTSMRVLQSSGYPELDQIAKDALMKWRFSPTSSSSTEQEAWGVITFRFTLS